MSIKPAMILPELATRLAVTLQAGSTPPAEQMTRAPDSRHAPGRQEMLLCGAIGDGHVHHVRMRRQACVRSAADRWCWHLLCSVRPPDGAGAACGLVARREAGAASGEDLLPRQRVGGEEHHRVVGDYDRDAVHHQAAAARGLVCALWVQLCLLQHAIQEDLGRRQLGQLRARPGTRLSKLVERNIQQASRCGARP